MPIGRSPSATGAEARLAKEGGRNRELAGVGGECGTQAGAEPVGRRGHARLHGSLPRHVQDCPAGTQHSHGGGRRKWAVVIGISEYRADGLNLRYADRDAEAIRDFLIEKGGFRPERVRFLSDQRATHEGIRTALFTFLAATQPEDMVLIFLAGHGVQDAVNPDNYFFLAHDSEPANLGGTAIPMGSGQCHGLHHSRPAHHDLRRYLPQRRGAGPGGAKDGKNLNFFNKYLEVLAGKKGRLVLTASQAHENSLETTKLGHGVFTHWVLRGLAGAADDNPPTE